MAAVPAFAEPAPNRKIDRGLQESLREGAAMQHGGDRVICEFNGDNIVWGTSVLKGGIF